MSSITQVTDGNFNNEVLEAEGTVLVDFWADWCGPCRMVAPVVEALAGEYEGRLKVAKVNVDANQKTAVHFGVMSIPTLIFFKNGEETKRLVGYLPKEKLKTEIDSLV